LNASLDSLVNDANTKSEICRDFNRGVCTRGRSCPFKHQRLNGTSEGEICRDFQRGSCPRGADCPYYHPKSNFMFSNDDGNHHTTDRRSSIDYHHPPLLRTVPQICKDNLRGECTRGAGCPYSHRTDFVAVCRDFVRGDCTRGSSCPYHHLLHLGSINEGKETNEICRDFQRGECPRHPCPFVHVPEFVEICRNFLDNKCRSGSRCLYHHPIPTENGYGDRKKRQRSSYDNDMDMEREKSPTQLNRELLDQIRLLKEENAVLKEENILIRTESNRLREKMARHGLDSYGL